MPADRRDGATRSAAVVAAALVVVAACQTAPVVTLPAPPPAPLDVDAKILPDASGRAGGVSLHYCPRAAMPGHLVPENRKALPFLVSAVDDDGNPIPVDAEGVKTRGLRGCARLVLDMGRMADELGDNDLAMRVGDDLVVKPDLWLWRAGVDDRAAPELFFKIDAAPFDALVPWKRSEGGRLVVETSTWLLRSDAAFGRFDVEDVRAGGARFRLARLDDGRAPPELARWLASSVEAVALVNGRYPLDDVNVLVLPTHVTHPIVEGFFSRGGGPTATFIVGEGGPDIRDGDLDATGRWVLTHELAHALLPAVRSPDAWFNEGLTTWHQDLLGRRAGMIADDEHYWHELWRGLETGRERASQDKLSIEQASTTMEESAAYQHAYWAGVALMLLAEVEARQQGASLDDLVIELRRRFVDDKPRAALALLGSIDDGRAGVAARVLERVWAAHKDEPFPGLAPTLQALGVQIDALGAVHLDDRAPLAAVRRAITQASRGADAQTH
jgi:hypothetical protein